MIVVSGIAVYALVTGREIPDKVYGIGMTFVGWIGLYFGNSNAVHNKRDSDNDDGADK
jgi:hypothetical protein